MRTSSTALILSSLPLAWAAFDCKGLSLNGNEFDLSSLSGVQHWEEQTNTPPTVTKTKYDLSLCSALPPPSSQESDDCPSGTRLCMRTFTSREGLEDRLLSVVPIAGELAGGPEMAVNAIKVEGVDESKEWLLEIKGGKYNEVDQLARIEMKCDQNAKDTKPTVKEYHSKQGVLDLEWTTAAACPLSKDGTPPPSNGDDEGDDEKKSSGGLGFFGWFFFLVFLALLGYFVLGSYHNHTTYGATGWDMIPHRDMWRDLPWVISDLFRARGGSRSGYSSLG